MSRRIVKTPCLRLAFVHLPFGYQVPPDLPTVPPVPLECTVIVRGAGDISLNIRNDVGSTVTQNALLHRYGMMSRILYKGLSRQEELFFGPRCQTNCQSSLSQTCALPDPFWTSSLFTL